MRPSRRITAAASGLLALSMFTTAILLQRLDQIRTRATLEEVLYISSPKLLKRLSLGYDGLLADIYWTRAVQYFGAKHHAGAAEYKLLGPLLEITTALDPRLLVAYEYGQSFLAVKPPYGAGEPQRAVQLEEFGIRNNPDDWRLYYNLGFIYYMELHDYPKAAEAFARGSKVPNAHPFLRILAANMAQHAGDSRMARAMWSIAYENSKDPNIRANAVAHLRALQVDDEVAALEAVVGRYKSNTGDFPASFDELIAKGVLRGVPVDPLGYHYKLMPDGRVQVAHPDDLPFIERGLPDGYVAPKIPKLLPSD